MSRGYLRLVAGGAALLTGSLPAAAQFNMPPPCGASFESVEQSEDGKVTFRLCAPEAGKVSLTSSDLPGVPFMGGLPLTKSDSGLWEVTTAGPVAPDTYRYNFHVNGVRVVDPLATTYSEERVGNNGTFEALGEAGAFQAYDKTIAHGTVTELEYWSQSLGLKRRAHVYLPPGYHNGNADYPVLYLVHGAGDSDDSWTSVGRAHYILDNLIAAGKAVPMVMVMPNAHTPPRPNPSITDFLVNRDFTADFFHDLIPLVERTFRVRTSAADRAMAGLSMGGAHTIQNGLNRPETFAYIGVFSIGLTEAEHVTAYEAQHADALARGAKSFKAVRYYMGKDDFLYRSVAPTRGLLDKHGVPYEYIETDGGHTWINWRRYLDDFLPHLFR